MPKLILPERNGAVRAIEAYDRSLRVRWSWEKQQWAIEAKALRPELMAPPVRFIPIPGTRLAREELLPELSDQRIGYREGTYVIAYCAGQLDMRDFEMIVQSDAQRYKRSLADRLEDEETSREIEMRRKKAERSREARKFLNWHASRNVMSLI